MKNQIIKLNDVKSANTRAVLEILLQSEGISRIELARKMNCDNTTISRVVRELMQQGVIISGTKSEQAHGRPRVSLNINPDGPGLLGISLEPDRIVGVLTDLCGRVRKCETLLFDGVPEKKRFLYSIESLIRRLSDVADERLLGIGASVFGSYSGEDYILENAAAFPQLNGLALAPFFEKCAGRKVEICDHLVSKMHFISHEYPEVNLGTTLLISAGRGIGLVIAENARLLFSPNNHGGEFGHSIYVPNGLLCACGRRGCLETVSSLTAVLQNCRQKLKRSDLDINDLAELLEQKNSVVEKELQTAVDLLGIAITNQLNNYPVKNLVITGTMLIFGDKFKEWLTERIMLNAFSSVKKSLNIHFIALDDDHSLARGAAILAAQSAIKNIDFQ